MVGIDLHASMLSNQVGGTLVARGEAVRVGRRVTVIRTTISGDDGKLLADVTTTHVPACASGGACQPPRTSNFVLNSSPRLVEHRDNGFGHPLADGFFIGVSCTDGVVPTGKVGQSADEVTLSQVICPEDVGDEGTVGEPESITT